MKTIFTHLLAALCLWIPVLALDVRPSVRSVSASTPPAAFTAQTAVFDGTNDYARLSVAATGMSDAKVFTFSCWVNFDDGGDGVVQTIFQIANGTTNRLRIYKDTNNKIHVLGESSGGTDLIEMHGGTNVLDDDTGMDGVDGWHWIFIVVNTNTEASCKIYLNGTPETMTYITRSTAADIDLAPGPDPRYTVGADSGNTLKLDAALAELVFYNTYHDSPGSFVSGTKPADIGATGATPTSAAPDFYFSRSGSGNSWATDSSGNGNTLTVTGTLTSATAP